MLQKPQVWRSWTHCYEVKDDSHTTCAAFLCREVCILAVGAGDTPAQACRFQCWRRRLSNFRRSQHCSSALITAVFLERFCSFLCYFCPWDLILLCVLLSNTFGHDLSWRRNTSVKSKSSGQRETHISVLGVKKPLSWNSVLQTIAFKRWKRVKNSVLSWFLSFPGVLSMFEGQRKEAERNMKTT